MNMVDDRPPLEWDQEHGMYIAVGKTRADPKPSDNTERRITYLTVELRSAAGEDGTPRRLIGGLAAVFNSPSRLIPGRQGPFTERVLPGFFDHDAAAHWPGPSDNGVVCRYNHKDEFLLGSSQSGTLQLRLDGRGLDYTVDVPRSREDVLEGVERRDIAASSFTFGLPDQGGDDWVYTDGVTQRTLVRGTLVDVAPVSALAAYPNANVALRSLAAFLDVPEDDVAAAAAQYELRRFFVRTDAAPLVPPDMPPAGPPDAPPAEPAEAGQQLELDVEPDGIPVATALARLRVLELACPINVHPRPMAEETLKEGVRP
jgi:phage head maturation protease